MKQVLVVYHSSCSAADAAGAGGEVDVRRLHAAAATPADVLAADAYLFVTPENLASMAGLMKDFFDRIYYPALERIDGRPYAVLIAAGTDGAGAARQIQRIATGLRLNEVAPPTIVRNGAQTPEQIRAMKTVPAPDRATAHDLGAALAAGLAAGIF